VLAKPSDEPNCAALAARLKRRLRLKAIAMSRSLWQPSIVGCLLRQCDNGGKDKDTDAKDAEMFFFAMKPKRSRR
jgi:hypothetical protein